MWWRCRWRAGEALTAKALPEQIPELGEEKARKAAAQSGGNVGRAKKLLADEKYAALLEKAVDLCSKMETADRFGILQVLAGFENDREGLLQCLEQVAPAVSEKYKGFLFCKKHPAVPHSSVAGG